MPDHPIFQLHAQSGRVTQPEPESDCWRLAIEPGEGNHYRWAQLDDYSHLPRNKFLWFPPVTLTLEARVSAPGMPGTWGFGFWNDPFNVSLGLGGAARRLPALPNTAWFFYASPSNYLSLRNDLPAQGMLAATFRSPVIPLPLMTFGLPLIPFLKWPWMARKLRSLASHFIRQSSTLLAIDCVQWHRYSLAWKVEGVTFEIDGEKVLQTSISPLGHLGLVLWIDNQYAAFSPQGNISMGTLAFAEKSWLEMKNISVVKETSCSPDLSTPPIKS